MQPLAFLLIGSQAAIDIASSGILKPRSLCASDAHEILSLTIPQTATRHGNAPTVSNTFAHRCYYIASPCSTEAEAFQMN